ncbi:hypothetical protein L218DRAFT_709059 [Marasmius fiardii PR-910]|nr:hypothetical protein L218DRAFT_709059 [Marasmius fiardii PR-910]
MRPTTSKTVMDDGDGAGGQLLSRAENAGTDDKPATRSVDSGVELVQEFGLLHQREKVDFLCRYPPEIFFALSAAGSNPIADPNFVDLPPLLLAHVCRQWRKIALSTPKLWVSLCRGPRFLQSPVPKAFAASPTGRTLSE